MKYFLALLFSFFLSFSTSYAQENTSDAPQIRGELIQEMHSDGFLDLKQKDAAMVKYAKEYEPGWKEHLTWINTFKVFGILLLIVAFSNLIFKIGTKFIYIILAVPVIFYQTLFLSLSVYGLLLPHDIWKSEYQYVALFCSISTLMTGFWIIEKHPKFFKKVFDYLFRFDLFVPAVISFWLSIYFGTLTYFYGSLFSWLAVISIGTFASSIFYQFTGLKLDIDPCLKTRDS